VKLLPWSTPFEDPIPLPGGKQLTTLQDAARFIQRLPKAEQRLPHWQLAVETLINCAEGRDFVMNARIGVLRALNVGVVREFTESKGHHWGKRKLKRDQ
jgi:hypothetical protein